jgi:hypothetical protein
MAFSVTHSPDPSTGDCVVTAKVVLSLQETNALFLSGDTIISWPEGSLVETAPTEQATELTGVAQDRGLDRALTRTGMFISELARLAQGLNIRYRQPAEAQRAAQLIRLQLLKAGIAEET